MKPMAASENTDEPTQTTPAGKKIPIPKRKTVLGDLKKIAHGSGPSSPVKKG